MSNPLFSASPQSGSGNILVAGITNLETTVAVEGFPLEYAKSRFAFHGITDRVGGVGYNVARALAALEAPVEFATMLGTDIVGGLVYNHLKEVPNLGCNGVLRNQPATPRSTVLLDGSGRGAIVTDLKNAQEVTYPEAALASLLNRTKILHATNINWAHAVAQQAKAKGVLVSTDVQALRTLNDPYNSRFLALADVVFFSGENLEGEPHQVVEHLLQQHNAQLVICTRAEKGALLGERFPTLRIRHQPAPPLRGTLQNATGAGDALVAGTLAALINGASPWQALLQGQIVAGYRVTQPSNTHGIPSLEWLENELVAQSEKMPS